MSGDNVKNESVRSKDNWAELGQIGDIFISCGWENNQAILILKNQGQNEESVEVRYQESRQSYTEPLKFFKHLPLDNAQRVPLPAGFEHGEKLHFNVGQSPRNSIYIKDLIAALNKSRDAVKNQGNPEFLQHEPESLSPKPEISSDPEKPVCSSNFQETEEQQTARLSGLEERLAEVKRRSQANEQLSTEPEQKQNSTSNHEKRLGQLEREIQNQQENIRPTPQNQITQLEQLNTELQNKIDRFREQIAELLQENSDLKQQLDTRTEVMSRDPEHVFREAAHHILQTLFKQHQKEIGETLQGPIQICTGIETEIRRFEAQFDGEMIYTLSVVKEHLTKVKGLIFFELSELSSPENQPEQLAELVLTDEPPENVQFPYLGELGKIYWDDLKAFTAKLPQVIAETQVVLNRIVIQLLDGFSPYRAKTEKEEQMSCCFYEDYLPNILQIIGLELVPIEIGQTEVDSRIHDIQGSQRGAYQRGVVAAIIQHGIRRISDKQIIRKPVVMRGEPE